MRNEIRVLYFNLKNERRGNNYFGCFEVSEIGRQLRKDKA